MRSESLKILERNLTGCGRILDLDMINETCFLIWNIALPFLKKEFRKNCFKAFSTAADLLEQIESNETQLRANVHFELTKSYLDDDLLQEADTHLTKALALDYSIPISKLGINAKPGDPNVNIQYLQRNLDQFLVFLKRSVGVKTNIYSDPQNLIDQLIFESDNIKHAKHEDIKLETIKKCVELIKVFKIDEFDASNYRSCLTIPKGQELVEEEMNELRIRHELKIYDDKKHFLNAAVNIAKLAYDLNDFDSVFAIYDKLAKLEWNVIRDVDQIIGLADLNLHAALSYEDLLLNEGIEAGIQELVNFNDSARAYSEEEKKKFNNFKAKIFEHIKEACKLAVSVGQYWLVFNCAIQLWNTMLQVIKSQNFVNICNENALGVFAEISEALNTCIIYMESINADLFDTDYFSKLDVFINLNAAYAKLLEAKNKQDECIKVCDLVLARKVNSNQRKIFDTIKARAAKGEKKPVAAAKAAAPAKNAPQAAQKLTLPNYNPTAEQLLISDCFANLEASLNSKDEKVKYELLKKAMDSLKNYKINFNDESSIEISAELWYKIGVQFYALGINNNNINNLNAIASNSINTAAAMLYFKTALLCADNCVKTFSPSDIKGFQIQGDFFKTYASDGSNKSNNNRNVGNIYNNNSNSNQVILQSHKNKNSTTTNIFNSLNSSNRDISVPLQKWYSVGFLLYGDCLNRLVDKEKQERLSQIKLYFTAIEKLIISAKIAEHCKQFYVILQATKAYYSIIIQIIDQPQNRERLVKLFLEIHKIYVNNRVGILYSDPEFLLLFYSLFCECINEIKDWMLGERIIGEALKILPQSVHHFVLEHKLFYHSKLGKNFLESLNSVDEKDVVTKAKLYAKLARSSKNKLDQYMSYNQAIDLLKNDQNIQVVDIIFELGTWLYKNNYPLEDIEDNLNMAADILLEIEPIYEEDDEIEDDGTTLHSKRSSSSRRSKLSKRSRSQRSQSKRQSDKNPSRTAKTNKDSRKQTKSRNYSSKQEKTKTVFARLLDVDPYPLYMNIMHFEKLFKIHIFMGMACDDQKKTQDYLLDSFFFLMKIIEISFKTLNCLDFYEKNKNDIIKFQQEVLIGSHKSTSSGNGSNSNSQNSQTVSSGSVANALGSNSDLKFDTVSLLVQNYFLTRELNIPEVYQLPENLEGWLNFEFPDFFIKKSAEFHEKTFFNKKSFEKPYQFYYYLKFLIEKFSNDFYFHSQLIAILKFTILFCELILQNQTLKFTYILQLKRLYHNILSENHSESFIKKEIDDKYLPGGSFSAYLMSNEKKTKSREELRKYDINLSTDEGFLADINEEAINNGHYSLIIIEDLKEHISNIELAKELINHGYYNFAKELLEESIFHCLVLKDKRNYIKANLFLAKILFIESEFEKSFDILNRIQALNCDIEMFYEIIYEITYILDYLQKYDDLGVFLDGAYDYAEALKKKQLAREDRFGISKGNTANNIRSSIKNNNTNNNQNTNTPSLSVNNMQLKKCLSMILLNTCKVKLKKNTHLTTAKEILDFYNKEIHPLLELFAKMISRISLGGSSSTNNNNNNINNINSLENNLKANADYSYIFGNANSIQNIKSLLEFCEISIPFLLNSNVFIHMNEEDLYKTKLIFENYLNLITLSQAYLTDMQSYTPARLDNSIIYLPLHRLIGLIKIKYCIINNLIGNLQNRIRKVLKRKEKNLIKNQNNNNNSPPSNSFINNKNLYNNIGKGKMLVNPHSAGSNNVTNNNNNNDIEINKYAQKSEGVSNNHINEENHNHTNNNYNNNNNSNINSNIKNTPTNEKSNINKDTLFVDPKTGIKYNQQVVDYLYDLTKEIHRIEKESLGVEHTPYELSISVLNSCASLIPADSQEHTVYLIEYINSLKLQSINNNELKNIWSSDLLKQINEANKLLTEGAVINESEIFKIKNFHQHALNLINDFEKKLAEKPKILSSSIVNIKNKQNLIYYISVAETSGYLNIELTFKAIVEYQNIFAKIFFAEIIEKYLNFTSRDWVALNSLKTSLKNFEFNIESITYPESISNTIKYVSELPFYKLLLTPLGWGEIKALLPYNSSYLIFQMSEDRSILYFGFMYFSATAEKKGEFYIKRISLDSEINTQIDNIINTIKKMKHSLVKSVMITNEDINKAYEQYDVQIKTITEYFQGLFPHILEDLDKIINPEIKAEDINAEHNANSKKAAAPAAGKKDPKATTLQDSSNTSLPTSLIESITFLIDYRFYELPFENLFPFGKIPHKSYDFSLHTLALRFKSNNYNPSSGNNLPIEKTGLKYYLDYSKNFNFSGFSKADPKKSVESKISLSSGKQEAKIEGLTSYEHYPSMPELQKIYSNSSAFIFFSQTALFYQYSPEEFLESSRFSKCKIALVLDRLCCTKYFVDQKSLIPKNFSFSNQPLDLIAILTLTGVSTILTTKWSLDMNEAAELLEDVLDEVGKNSSISYALNKYRHPKKVTVEVKNPNSNNNLNLANDTKTSSINAMKDKDKKGTKSGMNSTINKSDANTNANAFIKEEKIIEKKEVLKQAPIVFGINCAKLS